MNQPTTAIHLPGIKTIPDKKSTQVLAETRSCDGCRRILLEGTPIIAITRGDFETARIACSENCEQVATKALDYALPMGYHSPKFR